MDNDHETALDMAIQEGWGDIQRRLERAVRMMLLLLLVLVLVLVLVVLLVVVLLLLPLVLLLLLLLALTHSLSRQVREAAGDFSDTEGGYRSESAPTIDMLPRVTAGIDMVPSSGTALRARPDGCCRSQSAR